MKKHVNLENITILDLLYILTKKYNGNTALQIQERGLMRKLSYDDLREKSVGVSSFLIKRGIEKATHIAILSENRPEWAIAFFGIISAACVTVPIDAKLSMKEITFILNDSGAKVLLVSGKFWDWVISQRKDFPNLEYIISFDPCKADGVFN